VAATLALFFPMPWWTVGLLIVLGNIGFEGGNVYYNSFLPEIVPVEEQDQVSSAGYAFGYIGGVIVLIAILQLFTDSLDSIRYGFILVGLWWGGFGLITFSLLREHTAAKAGDAGAASGSGVLGALAAAWRELKSTVGNISRVPQAALFLLAFLLYNDGIATLISNVTPFALQNIYLDAALTQRITIKELIQAIIMIQLIAFPSAIFFGWLATRIGEKATLYITLAVYTAVVSYGQVVTQIGEFYGMAAAVGLVLGGSQAISRSLFASFIPQGKSAEFFAFFAFSSKFSAMAGPFIYGGLLLLTGDTRLSLLSLTVFFVAGGAVLYFVDVEKGRADALREG
jgi:UMF1 family MFS transporter